MKYTDYLSILNTVLLFLAAVFVLQFLFRWQRQREVESLESKQYREQQSKFEEMKLVMEREAALKNQAKQDTGQEAKTIFGPGQGGYIILDLADSRKALFHDLLRGFEDYARIRGYEIQFSVDNTLPDQIAFKFTLGSNGITVSTNQVKQDLKDYIQKVQKGDPLDDLPVVLPAPEHNALVLAMKNRINFLQHTYTAHKNAVAFYEALLRELPAKGFGIQPPQNFYLTGGGSIESPNYLALNSPQAAQGSGIRMIGNKVDQSIYVANSFNERKGQIEALQKLIHAIWADKTEGEGISTKRLEAVKYVEKIKDELEEENQPEPSRIHSWLEKAKNSLATFAL
ncbi:MAG: hypothetical protein WAO21_12550 [Verrucomicrobiia bacterium]